LFSGITGPALVPHKLYKLFFAFEDFPDRLGGAGTDAGFTFYAIPHFEWRKIGSIVQKNETLVGADTVADPAPVTFIHVNGIVILFRM
jgi:hypothetical protein